MKLQQERAGKPDRLGAYSVRDGVGGRLDEDRHLLTLQVPVLTLVEGPRRRAVREHVQELPGDDPTLLLDGLTVLVQGCQPDGHVEPRPVLPGLLDQPGTTILEDDTVTTRARLEDLGHLGHDLPVVGVDELTRGETVLDRHR